MSHDSRSHACWFTAFACLALTIISGCGKKDNLHKAKAVVETALGIWKNAGNPQELVGQGIEIIDPDWQAGHRLLEFAVKNASSQPQQGPRVFVVLTMQDKTGKNVDTEVAYEVILADKAKIGRDAFYVGP
ncbi:MAG: hypothetical protein EXS16_21550 [Gemmataceae bacterium]|nr:hypothetical protein [Gemmataceae bacterium]